MTTPMCEDSGPLREWAPLAALLQKIPAKIQSGIFTHDISFTCIDAVPEFIAIGTNHGLVYWYNRETHDLQRLRCENANIKITCVQVISTVDYMVAVGNENGVITVFQIPKNLPDSLPDSLKPKHKKQVERYSISGLHKSSVTTVEWSKNGMKLFSGDQDGLVVLTEIDFYMHLSKSSELLNEKYSVVQLSYQQGLLLVSTVLRTILVNRNENGKVIQVGQKERKSLGKLGAVFGLKQSHTQEPMIYASRPGLRLWQADKTGTVLKTLIFKDAINSGNTEVSLLNPAPENARKCRGESTFGVVLPFCDDLLLTYSDDIIYVVNPRTIAITSVITDLRRITHVACTKDEIFVLEGERNIIRIAYYPETNDFASETSPTLDPFTSIAEISKPVTNGLIELTNKLKESAIVPAIPFHRVNNSLAQSVGVLAPVAIGTDPSTITNAEEAIEVPPIIPIELNTELVADIDGIPVFNDAQLTERTEHLSRLQNDRIRIFDKIGEQEFEDVVFTPERKARRNKSKTNDSNSPSSDKDDSSLRKIETSSEAHTTHSSLLSLSVTDEFSLNVERNLESIKKDVENKEKLLADVLDFDLSKYMSSSQVQPRETDITTSMIDAIPSIDCFNGNYNHLEEIDREENSLQDGTELGDDEDEDVSYRTELEKLEELKECRKKLIETTLRESTDRTDVLKFTLDRDISHNSLEVDYNDDTNEANGFTTLGEEGWVLVKDDIPSIFV